jgi:cobalamin biosynthesis protein CbiD
LNARRSHIKNRIGYKANDKHNSRVNTRGQEFIKFTKGNIQHEKKQSIKTTNNVSYSYDNTSHISHMSYHDFDVSYVLMRNKFGKIIALHVGPHHKRSKTCVWVLKCLVTNLRGLDQTWIPKNKA